MTTPAKRPSQLPYGQELILDLHDCDASRFSRSSIQTFLKELCEQIDMERCDLYFWDDVGVPDEEWQTGAGSLPPGALTISRRHPNP